MSHFPSVDHEKLANEFITFMNESCTAFHAVVAAKTRLLAAGFIELYEQDEWSLHANGKYFFIRNSTTIMAFAVGGGYVAGNGFTALGAHTDSPCLRVKPVTTLTKGDALMINTQPYGGGLWHTWFDRDLGLAGRVLVKSSDGGIQSHLININEPIARIPNLAIHLTSGSERESFAPNLQEHGKAILTMLPNLVSMKDECVDSAVSARLNPLILQLVANKLAIDISTIVDLELQLIDIQPSCLGGAGSEFILSGRLDNLCSAYQCLAAIIDEAQAPSFATAENIFMCMLFDHEECGSASLNGAGSSIFMNTITLINQSLTDGTSSTLMRSLRKSFVVSIDMAHGLHPNYPGKHDNTMAPKFNGGLVIKHNANQRYATNAVSATMFREFAKIAGIPVQEFTVRSDSACGSTIGPIISTLSGILTVDCGTPQYSMHSIREMMGSHDIYTGYAHLRSTLKNHPALFAKSSPAL